MAICEDQLGSPRGSTPSKDVSVTEKGLVILEKGGEFLEACKLRTSRRRFGGLTRLFMFKRTDYSRDRGGRKARKALPVTTSLAFSEVRVCAVGASRAEVE